MPNPNNHTTSSPVKRPGLGRRAVSSHAVVTRSNSSTSGDLSDPHGSTTSSHSQKPHHASRNHHHLRPHLVGHRQQYHHHRNPSSGKNVNKLQRLAPAITDTGRNHQRKKSAPATPAASPPRGGHHVRWEGESEDLHPDHSIKRNNSSPALRRLHATGGGAGKKALSTERPRSSSGKKKTVGFELGDTDNDDGEWEDTTQSPESTRRGSVVQTKEGADNAAALVDPLVFVKRPYPQIPRATSLPEPTSQNFAQEGQSTDEEEGKQQEKPQGQQQEEEGQQEQEQPQPQSQQQESEERQETGHAPESSVIASRLLSPSLSAKVPPAMSSISAMVEPTAADGAKPPNTSLNTLASGQDGSRRPVYSSNPLANTPGNQTQATSSSIEGGVSRFIVNNRPGNQPYSRTDSDPNTPSSFLPHYHPSTPPSPGRAPSSQKPRASPPTRPPGLEPPSRTQQKLWLQRTAALNTSPPDSHASTTVSPSAMDPAFMAAARPDPDPMTQEDLSTELPERAAQDTTVKPSRPARRTRKQHWSWTLCDASDHQRQIVSTDCGPSFTRAKPTSVEHPSARLSSTQRLP